MDGLSEKILFVQVLLMVEGSHSAQVRLTGIMGHCWVIMSQTSWPQQ